MGRGRKTLYKQEIHCPWIESLTRDGLTEKEAAKAMGISYPTLRDWKKKYMDFCFALEQGRIPFKADMENRIVALARGGDSKAFQALKFILERRFADDWKEKREETVNINKEITAEDVEEFEAQLLR